MAKESAESSHSAVAGRSPVRGTGRASSARCDPAFVAAEDSGFADLAMRSAPFGLRRPAASEPDRRRGREHDLNAPGQQE